jgi:hypothetical protein
MTWPIDKLYHVPDELQFRLTAKKEIFTEKFNPSVGELVFA